MKVFFIPATEAPLVTSIFKMPSYKQRMLYSKYGREISQTVAYKLTGKEGKVAWAAGLFVVYFLGLFLQSNYH